MTFKCGIVVSRKHITWRAEGKQQYKLGSFGVRMFQHSWIVVVVVVTVLKVKGFL